MNTTKILNLVENATESERIAQKLWLQTGRELAQALAGKCFIYKTECTTIIAKAEKCETFTSNVIVSGEAITLDDYGLTIQNEVRIDAIGLTSLTIISEADFERLSQAAGNILNDYQRQIDEFNIVINSMKPINKSIKLCQR